MKFPLEPAGAGSFREAGNRRLLEIEKHYSLELCFSIEKQPEQSIRGLLSKGAGGSGQAERSPNGSNDIDETAIEYCPGA